MDIFESIYNDKSIYNRYKEIEMFEDKTDGWAHHNWTHVMNVTTMTESILKQLNVSDEYIEASKIAAILHDIGANEGKDGHALRGEIYARKYFIAHNLDFSYRKETLSSIENHSGGFDSTELMTLALIISDKLDITKSRVGKAGYLVEGMRQLQYIERVSIEITKDIVKVIFESSPEIDIEELSSFYFIHKVFRAVDSFSKKIKRTNIIEINGTVWNIKVNNKADA